MRASISRIVIVRFPFATSPGAKTAPAIINRVWDENDTAEKPSVINTTAFPDGAPPVCVTSIKLYENQAAADQAEGPTSSCAWWPERVGP